MEFKSFREIKAYRRLRLSITQKIHGTNAQVCIFPDTGGYLHLKVGCRTRWITPESDNFGFAAFVYANKEEFISKLGEGTHHGEWAGPGINSGEGLKEKTFVLFNFERYQDLPLPPQTVLVPVLYDDVPESINNVIDNTFEDLKSSGSKLVPGFAHPEGIVISLNGSTFKKVFKPEETQWTKKGKPKEHKEKAPGVDASHLLQPIRLEKLISKDESYSKNYPESIGLLCREYILDLEKEDQLLYKDEDELKGYKKAISGQVFKFIKSAMEEYIETGKISE